MDLLAVLTFWACLLALIYTYVGYPLVLALVARREGLPAAASDTKPSISVIVAAYNEEHCITNKIRNALEQDYPSDLVELLVISDGSTDHTVEVATRTADPRLRVVGIPLRQGKAMALNRGAAEAKGSVLVFTDANAMLEPSALSRLARPFSDPRVGLVSGRGVFLERRGNAVHLVTNAYLAYETFLRRKESTFGYIVWADGALYALRRSLFQGLQPVHANDFLHPIQTVLQGYRAVLEPSAIFTEETSGSASGELRRQARMIGQGVYILANEGPRLAASGRWIVLWQLLSHRLLRWLGSLFLVGLLVGNVVLVQRGLLYLFFLSGQLGFYGAALMGRVGEARGWRIRAFSLPYYFCLVNVAGVIGFLRFLGGRVQATWTPVRTN